VTLLEIELETGRTHQIRVHLSALHHPLVGDLTYGSDPALAKRLNISRPWLHAKQLGFDHPANGQRLSFAAEYPPDLTRSLEVLSDISR
jgi:23S rRNA pseudouridine1911/1915/1917 synthase